MFLKDITNCLRYLYDFSFRIEVDCMETTLQQLYGSTSPILEVYKTESPFVNQRRKRHVVEEDIYREVHGRS